MTIEIGANLKDLLETLCIAAAVAYAYISFLRM